MLNITVTAELLGEGTCLNTKSVASEVVEDDKNPLTRIWNKPWKRALL